MTPAQSATIVSIIAHRLDRWIAARNPTIVVLPGLADITLHRDGHLWWYRGRSVAKAGLIRALGELLDNLMHAQGRRVPPGLLYVVARATDPGHLAPFESLREFIAAVERYASDDPARTLDGLLAYYFMRCSGHPPLSEQGTISDVRRLRRAGGVPLRKIATDTGIPLSLLRELEWGVLVNWDPSHTARSLQAYSERAGLDAATVEAVVRREFQQQTALAVTTAAELPVVSVLPAPAAARVVGLPFAFVAALVACVALAPPDSNSRPARFAGVQDTAAAQARPASLVVPMPAEEGRSVVGEAAPEPPEEESRPIGKRLRTSTRRKPFAAPASGVVVPSADRATPASRRNAPPRGIARFARAVVGDGRYKVEPFPRVQN